jgi:hypothetical protein
MVVTAVTTLTVVLAGSSPIAYACSCAGPGAPQHRLSGAEVAFVGTPLKVERVSRTVGTGDNAFSGDSDRYTMRVDEVVKGELPSTVELDIDGVGTSCDMGSLTLNQRIGVIPNGTRERYSLGFCAGPVGADELLDLKGGSMPAPEGEGPVAGLILAPAGPAQMVAVDDQARVLGYVVGLRGPQSVAACPGGSTAVVLEIDYTDDTAITTVARVDLASLRVTARVDIPVPEGGYFYASRTLCTSPTGTAALFVNGEGSGRSSYIVFVEGGETSFRSVGAVLDVVGTDDGRLFGIADDEVVTIGADGDIEVLAELPDGTAGSMVGLDDGKVLVAITDATVEGYEVLTGVAAVDVADGNTTFTPFSSDELLTVSEWVDGTLNTYGTLDGTQVRFDARLNELDRSQGGQPQATVGSAIITWGWEGNVTVAVGGTPTDSLAAIGAPVMIRRVQPTTEVRADSPGAQALPYTATAEEILGENPDTAEPDPGGIPTPAGTSTESSRLPWVLAGLVAAAAVVVAIGVAWRLRARRAGAVHDG